MSNWEELSINIVALKNEEVNLEQIYNIQVPIDIKFLNKNSCLAMADRIIAEHGENGECNGMSRKRIAKELYAHAIGYYTGSALEGAGLDGSI